MNSKRPAVVKNIVRAASGGVLAVIALIAMLFFRGGSPGEGESEGDPTMEGTPMVSADTTGDSGSPAATTSETDASEDDLTADEKQALTENVLGIMIDETSYFLVIPGDDVIYRPEEMERLVEVATHAPGDSNGIRVRILRRETSRTKAELDLKTALSESGIGEDAVYMPKELLPKAQPPE